MGDANMNINWLSNAPWAPTGYGNQTNLFAPRIKTLGHEVSITANYGLEGKVLNWDGMQVYPKGRDQYSQDIAVTHAKHAKADILLTLFDAWVFKPEMLQQFGMRWVPWFPVDMEPLPIAVKRSVEQAHARIVYSKRAEKMVNDAGLDCYYVPHGIDTNEFKPGVEDEARGNLKWGDRFIVGMVAANKGTPSRKALPEHLAAFAEFHRRHPDTALYMHCTTGVNGENQAVNLPELCEFYDLVVGEDVLFPNMYSMLSGHYNNDYMRAIYNAMDVFLLASTGEGFGIPIVEAQACGTPVIVGDWTATAELCFSGWKIAREDADPWWTPLGAFQFKPRVGAIVEALEQAYKSARADSYRKAARKGARAYDADRVTRKYWKPVLESIEAGLGGGDNA